MKRFTVTIHMWDGYGNLCPYRYEDIKAVDRDAAIAWAGTRLCLDHTDQSTAIVRVDVIEWKGSSDG